MSILHRYVWKDFFHQFLLWGSAITVLGLGKIFFDYNDLFIGYRVTTGLLLRLLLNQLPSLWMDVIPFATLLGVVLSLGRLLRERELDVMRISGASLIRITLPLYIGVAIICGGAFFWNDLVVPAANHRFQVEVRRLSFQEDLPLLRENVVFKGPNNRFIYLNKVDHQQSKVSGVLIIEAGSNGRWPRLITAEYGILRRGIWELYNGITHDLDHNGAVTFETQFKKMSIKMGNDFASIIETERAPGEMRSGELLELISRYKRSGLNIPIYTVFYHSKFADPLISLVLVFLAVPLTVSTGRNSRWVGFVYCILIIMCYYGVQVVGRTMGTNNLIPAWTAVWTPHIAFAILGFILLQRTTERR